MSILIRPCFCASLLLEVLIVLTASLSSGVSFEDSLFFASCFIEVVWLSFPTRAQAFLTSVSSKTSLAKDSRRIWDTGFTIVDSLVISAGHIRSWTIYKLYGFNSKTTTDQSSCSQHDITQITPNSGNMFSGSMNQLNRANFKSKY